MKSSSLVIEFAPARRARLEATLRVLLVLLFVSLAGIFAWLVMGPLGERFQENINLRYALFVFISACGALLYKAAFRERGWAEAVLAAPLFYGFVYKLAVFIPYVSTYPFSMGWSEASRYYYASLFFAQKIYGEAAPLSVLHPSRYLMQSLPFLVDGAPLWLHRLWQVLLWVVFAFLVGVVLARRLSLADRSRQVLLTLWAFLFLFQGPVYYHLLVMPLLILLTFDARRPWRTLFFVLVASAWGGISRVNWIPFPGMLAAVLYLLEVPQEQKPFWRYLVLPVVWFAAGSAVGLASQQVYQLISGNPAIYFGTSFTSELLWYRLKPSVTYPMGVLKSAVLASLPAALILLVCFFKTWRAYRPWRILGLAAALFVLLAGGIVVSVKIGGGSNLHNLDGFLVMLLVVVAYWGLGAFVPDSTVQPLRPGFKFLFAAAALVMPLYFLLPEAGPLPVRDLQGAQAALQTLTEQVEQAASAGGEVLFISERHLLSQGIFENVAHVHEYEKVFLMEMAMANHGPYLEAFKEDLRSHRFALIVSETLYLQYQGRSKQFGEENDAWVRGVSEPMLCYYEPLLTLEGYHITLYTPELKSSCP
jgi:hypothetical protein